MSNNILNDCLKVIDKCLHIKSNCKLCHRIVNCFYECYNKLIFTVVLNGKEATEDLGRSGRPAAATTDNLINPLFSI